MTSDAVFRGAALASVAGRFADFEHIVEALAFTGLEQRLASALLRMWKASFAQRMRRLPLKLAQREEAISRQLGVLARQRLVVLARGRVEIIRRDTPSRLAQPSV